jgi:hypothetical protein
LKDQTNAPWENTPIADHYSSTAAIMVIITVIITYQLGKMTRVRWPVETRIPEFDTNGSLLVLV